MALTGLQIYKLLPQTNCKECGYPTCLAFAMKLSAQKEDLSKCPDASEEAKSALGAASAPPIKLITIGIGEDKIQIGEETVLFRHDKTFFHHPALGEILPDTCSETELKNRITYLKSLDFERAGECLKIDLVAIEFISADEERFKSSVKIVKDCWKRPVALISKSPKPISLALKEIGEQKPLLISTASSMVDTIEIAHLAREFACPIIVCGDGTMEGTLKMIGEVKKVGCEDIIINPMSASLNTHLAQQTLLRRLALDRLDPNAGYPTAVILRGENLSILAPMAICKYPAVILLDTPADELYLPLLTLRQNIYTDPQKPLQVESRVYPIGEPQENSPLVVTTNFSLTYFMVSSEIDASGVPTHLAIVDAEGMSVLTAWSAGKFSAQIIAKALKEMKVENLVKHRKLIIPGYVASLKGELEEEMPGWEALVGPQEASDIGDFFLEMWKN